METNVSTQGIPYSFDHMKCIINIMNMYHIDAFQWCDKTQIIKFWNDDNVCIHKVRNHLAMYFYHALNYLQYIQTRKIQP